MPIQTATVVATPDANGLLTITIHTPNGPMSVGPFDPRYAQQLVAVGHGLPVVEPHRPTGAKKRLRRRSIKQENEIAARDGGSRVRGSGAGRIKGDVRNPGIKRTEAKFTTDKKSFTIRHEELAKIRAEAKNLEVPAYEVHFVDPQTLKAYDRWMLIDARFYEMMEYKPAYATTLDSGLGPPST